MSYETTIVRDFNIPLSSTNRPNSQKKKWYLSYITDWMDLFNGFTTFHKTTKQYTLFSLINATFFYYRLYIRPQNNDQENHVIWPQWIKLNQQQKKLQKLSKYMQTEQSASERTDSVKKLQQKSFEIK